MKEETIEKIENEITKKTTMPDDLKHKIRKAIFINIILGIGIIVYFAFLVLGSIDSVKATRDTYFKIFSMVLLFVSIALFEIAYKRDSGKLAINGIELLVVSIFTLFMPYIVFELDRKHQMYYVLASSLIGIYYIIKSIIINKRAKSLFEKRESDIKEIVKNENKKADFLEEEQNEEEVKQDEKPKRKGRPKKLDKKEESAKKQTDEEQKEKKVKSNSSNNTEKKSTTKKRGRPRKVVSN